jgi:hypothetical protein
MGGFLKKPTHPRVFWVGFNGFYWVLMGFNWQFPNSQNKPKHVKKDQIYFTLSLNYTFLLIVIGIKVLV